MRNTNYITFYYIARCSLQGVITADVTIDGQRDDALWRPADKRVQSDR